MDTTLLHPLPRRGAVLREQLRTVGFSLRREAALAAGGLGALSAWVLSIHATHLSGPEISLVPDAMVPAVLVALFAALAVWKGQDPARRGYHWSMPVDHAGHALARALSGWAWLVAAIGAYMAWLGVMAIFTGGGFAVESRWEGHRGMVVSAVAAWRWLVPFAGATILYLFGTALALASRHPWRWLAGGAVGFVFLTAWAASLGGRTPLHEAIETLWAGEYGLRTAISGLSPNPSGYGSHGLFYVGAWGMIPSLGAWIAAAALWLAGALGIAALAARRQPRG
jgi:hypothetical protein